MNVKRTLIVTAGLIAVLLAATTGPAAASAASKPARVTGVVASSQDWSTQTVRISWAKTTAATSYVAKWSSDVHFQNPTYANASGTALNAQPLRPNVTYYVVVAAKNAAGVGPWSATLQTKLKPQSVSTFGTVTATPTATGVRVTFPAVAYASDYRVRWSAGPNENRTPDRWQEHYSSWFSAFGTKKTYTYDVPASDADLTSVGFGNPLYVRIQARNTYYDSAYIRKSTQVHAWPTPVVPVSSGTQIRVANYNVMCAGCEPTGGVAWAGRVGAIASVINKTAPDVLTVEEASGRASASSTLEAYSDLANRLNNLRLADTSAGASGATEKGTRIYFNPGKFTLKRSGYLSGVKDYRTYPQSAASNTQIPWAELAVNSSPTQRFIVVAAHYGLPSATYGTAKKSLLGTNSAQLLTALASANPAQSNGKPLPVILGGDLNDHRYPENETNGAQPTLVRGGFYDASASQKRVGTAKPTYNGYKAPSAQADDPNQDGLRIDYILTQGMRGSLSFTNDWNPGTSVVPSDHNLISTDVRLPSAG